MISKQALSGVSLAISKTMVSLKNGRPLIEKDTFADFVIKIANNLEERQAAFELAYQIYLKKGFINQNDKSWYIQDYDANDETTILIVKDQQKNIVGSVTLVFDGKSKLPAEKIYHKELKTMRDAGSKLVELSRLVINPVYRNSKEILILLFNYAAIFICQVKKYNCLSIQVNPRHKNYYRELLKFSEIGEEKPCPQVQNAPAVLLSITETQYHIELDGYRISPQRNKKERSLYPYFLKAEQESLVAYYLEKQMQVMKAEEKKYFGIT